MRPIRSSSSDGTSSRAERHGRLGGVDHHRPLDVVGIGIEAGLEQVDDQAGQLRQPRQRFLDVSLAEGESGLVGVLRVTAQHVHLRCRQSGQQDQPVEPVGLDRARQETFECTAHFGVAQVADLHAFGHPNADVVQEALGTVEHESIRMLIERSQTEVAEQWQEVGEGNRVALAIHAHPPHTVGGRRSSG